MGTKEKSWMNIGLLVLTLGINFLGGAGFINNASQAEVSREYQTLITPAGFAFSIWSLIYGLLMISLIVMLVKRDETYYRKAIDVVSPIFWISCVFNMVWIVSFSYYQIGLSNLFIFGYLISLTLIVQKLLSIQDGKRWLLPLTFGLNAGWLFIASVVNVSAYLVQIDWDGFGVSDETWAIIMLAVSVVLALVVLLRLKNAAFPLPIAWAYFAIFQELISVGGYSAVAITAIVGMVVLLLLAVFMYVRNNKAVTLIR